MFLFYQHRLLGSIKTDYESWFMTGLFWCGALLYKLFWELFKKIFKNLSMYIYYLSNVLFYAYMRFELVWQSIPVHSVLWLFLPLIHYRRIRRNLRHLHIRFVALRILFGNWEPLLGTRCWDKRCSDTRCPGTRCSGTLVPGIQTQ